MFLLLLPPSFLLRPSLHLSKCCSCLPTAKSPTAGCCLRGSPVRNVLASRGKLCDDLRDDKTSMQTTNDENVSTKNAKTHCAILLRCYQATQIPGDR